MDDLINYTNSYCEKDKKLFFLGVLNYHYARVLDGRQSAASIKRIEEAMFYLKKINLSAREKKCFSNYTDWSASSLSYYFNSLISLSQEHNIYKYEKNDKLQAQEILSHAGFSSDEEFLNSILPFSYQILENDNIKLETLKDLHTLWFYLSGGFTEFISIEGYKKIDEFQEKLFKVTKDRTLTINPQEKLWFYDIMSKDFVNFLNRTSYNDNIDFSSLEVENTFFRAEKMLNSYQSIASGYKFLFVSHYSTAIVLKMNLTDQLFSSQRDDFSKRKELAKPLAIKVLKDVSEFLPYVTQMIDSVKSDVNASYFGEYLNQFFNGFDQLMEEIDNPKAYSKLILNVSDLKLSYIEATQFGRVPPMYEYMFHAEKIIYLDELKMAESFEFYRKAIDYFDRHSALWDNPSIHEAKIYSDIFNSRVDPSLYKYYDRFSDSDILILRVQQFIAEQFLKIIDNSEDKIPQDLFNYLLISYLPKAVEFKLHHSQKKEHFTITDEEFDFSKDIILESIKNSNEYKYYYEDRLAKVIWSEYAYKNHIETLDIVTINELITILRGFTVYDPSYELFQLYGLLASYQKSEKQAQEVNFMAARVFLEYTQNKFWQPHVYYDYAVDFMGQGVNYKFTSNIQRQEYIDLNIEYLNYLTPYLGQPEQIIEDSLSLNSQVVVEKIRLIEYNIADSYYWMEDFKKCYEFYNKNEATINLISNDSLRDFYRAQNYEEQIWVLNRNLKRRKDANKINTDYLDFIFGIEVIDISHYNCKKVDKKIGSYTIPFFQITFDLPDFFYPIIEFDVNANGKIDSTIDTRYFYNYQSNKINTEYIKTIDYDIIGGFYEDFENRDGTARQDTSSLIFIDKSPNFESGIFWSVEPLSSPHPYSGLKFEGKNIAKWTIEIPIEEITTNNNNRIHFLVTPYTQSPPGFIHSKRHEKYIFPPSGRIYQFEQPFVFSFE